MNKFNFFPKIITCLKSCMNSAMLKMFCCLTGVYAVAITALIRSNAYYIDDIGRAAHGYNGFGWFNRYAAYVLIQFIHADHYLTDISPFPQFLAIIICAGSGTLLYRYFTDKTVFSFWGVIGLIPLALCPYFLECLSYKYDAPYMAISLFVSIVPFLFYSCGTLLYFLISIFCILIMCTTYQASSGIFPMVCVLLCFRAWNSGTNIKKIGKFLLVSVVAYCSTLIFYYLFLVREIDDYISTSLPSMSDFVPLTIQHYISYYNYVITDFKKIWLFFIGMLFITFCWVNCKHSSHNRVSACLMSLFALVLLLLLCFGIYPALSLPLYEPRAMYGFGVLLSLVMISVLPSPRNYFGRFFGFLLSWCFFIFTFTYGNALNVQQDYTDFRIQTIINDIDDLDVMASDEPVKIAFSGDIGYSPIIENMPQNYQILNRLIPITMKADWRFGTYKFLNYYKLPDLQLCSVDEISSSNLTLVKESCYHTIYIGEQQIYVDIH